jgi:hypothetical protein
LFAGVVRRFDNNDTNKGAPYSALETSFNEMKEAMLRDSSQSSFEPAPTDVHRNSAQEEETKMLSSPHEVKSYLNKFIINTK